VNYKFDFVAYRPARIEGWTRCLTFYN
jgi:hypothetical protein